MYNPEVALTGTVGPFTLEIERIIGGADFETWNLHLAVESGAVEDIMFSYNPYTQRLTIYDGSGADLELAIIRESV